MLGGPAHRQSTRATDTGRSSERRARAAGVAIGVLAVVCLFAPWLSQSATVHTLTGRRTVRVSMTGWQALPVSAMLLVVLGVGLIAALLISRGSARRDGTVTGLAGIACTVALVWTIADHSSTTATAVAVVGWSVRWGLAMSLLVAIAMIVVGVRLAASGTRPAVAAGPRSGADDDTPAPPQPSRQPITLPRGEPERVTAADRRQRLAERELVRRRQRAAQGD